jgi:hypothetical protein
MKNRKTLKMSKKHKLSILTLIIVLIGASMHQGIPGVTQLTITSKRVYNKAITIDKIAKIIDRNRLTMISTTSNALFTQAGSDVSYANGDLTTSYATQD